MPDAWKTIPAKRESGTGLVSAMVALGCLGIIVMNFGEMFKNSLHGQVHVSIKIDIDQIRERIRAKLMHAPLEKIQEASENGGVKRYLEALHSLFDLDKKQ